jgi:hypothetical protein
LVQQRERAAAVQLIAGRERAATREGSWQQINGELRERAAKAAREGSSKSSQQREGAAGVARDDKERDDSRERAALTLITSFSGS